MLRTRSSRRFVLVWAAVWSLATASQLLVDAAVPRSFVAPHLIFWVVVIGAGGCVLVSGVVVVRALRENVAETALLGSFLVAVSVLPLAHGLLIPGVLYDANAAVSLSVQLAIPVGAIALVPLLGREGRLSRWRGFVIGHITLAATIAAALLVFPDALPAAPSGSAAAIGFAVVGFGVCLALSIRQLRLALIAQRRPALAIAAGLSFIGVAPLVFVTGSAFSAAFWSAHLFDITGVFLAAGTAVFAHRRGATLRSILAPLEAATPLRSLAIGLDPLVHRLVADLDAKDPITRDHVVRTARLAVLVASEMRLAPTEIRDVGLGAILHDVGKLALPDEILAKPDRLSDAEYEIVKDHTTVGDELVRNAPALRNAAPFVRGHHERVDGRGYPDRLRGDEIPLGARIVAVCDAWDAMSYTRQYRVGMDRDRVIAILREHEDAQWDATVVAALLRVVERETFASEGPELHDVGRDGASTGPVAPVCCPDAVPI